MTAKQYANVFHRSIAAFQAAIGTANPDMSAFKAAGGKILSWQGLADQLVPPDGTAQYYDQVLSLDPAATDFYRLFFAPGTYHCAAGIAPHPYDTLDTLVKWVEEGNAPDTLTAANRTSTEDGAVRLLCPYPRIQTYVGGDGQIPASFTCI